MLSHVHLSSDGSMQQTIFRCEHTESENIRIVNKKRHNSGFFSAFAAFSATHIGLIFFSITSVISMDLGVCFTDRTLIWTFYCAKFNIDTRFQWSFFNRLVFFPTVAAHDCNNIAWIKLHYAKGQVVIFHSTAQLHSPTLIGHECIDSSWSQVSSAGVFGPLSGQLSLSDLIRFSTTSSSSEGFT